MIKQGRGVGCLALLGLVMAGSGLLTILVAAGASAGLLRKDPQGMMLLAVVLILMGAAVFVSAMFRNNRG